MEIIRKYFETLFENDVNGNGNEVGWKFQEKNPIQQLRKNR